MVVVLAADADKFQRAFHHTQRRIAVAVHDAVGQRTVVGANAHGAAEFLALQHQRRERLLQPLEFIGVLIVAVLACRKFLAVGVVARIDADLLAPQRRFHRRGRHEMDIGDNRRVQPAFAKFGDDVLEILRVVDRRRGDAQDFAAGFNDRDRLLDAGVRVHGVADQHRLDADRIVAANADGTDLDLAGQAPSPEKGGFTIVHG